MRFIMSLKRAIIISVVNVLLLLFLSYILNNQPLFTGEDLNQYAWMELLKEKLGLSNKQDYEDALFINVAYDKQLIEYQDDYGMALGNIDITDRGKLLQLLTILERSRQYKYIFLDVIFEKGYKTPVDSALFSMIKNMKNIVIVNHSDIALSDLSLKNKSAINEYASTIVATNFTRFVYLHGQQASMPLYAYRSLTGKDISRYGLFYTCDGKLCQNSLFLRFPTKGLSEYDANNERMYYNLGSDLLESYSVQDLALLTKDKYVFIGDMVEDVHDTYAGLKPGIIITYQALQALLKNEHIVPIGLIVILSIIYFLISLSLLRSKSVIDRIPIIKHSHSKIINFIVSFLGYVSVLFAVVVVLNLFFDKTISILIPSLFFATLNLIIKYKRTEI